MLVLTTLLLGILIFGAIYYHKRDRRRQILAKMPGPSGWPFVGVLPSFLVPIGIRSDLLIFKMIQIDSFKLYIYISSYRQVMDGGKKHGQTILSSVQILDRELRGRRYSQSGRRRGPLLLKRIVFRLF